MVPFPFVIPAAAVTAGEFVVSSAMTFPVIMDAVSTNLAVMRPNSENGVTFI
jgi:hypothetical protein